MKTFHIHIKGIVQGVGFRPFVYKMAKKENLKGWVNNTNDGVHIEINADEKTSRNFLQKILDNLPPLAVVTEHHLKAVKNKIFHDFEIIKSEGNRAPNLLITPDVAMCQDCRHELHDPANRRYHYPFITCTNCGPRYSIIKKLPYDRPNTTMADFKMCEICWEEYNNPMERRHFSQTNSCPDCPVEMQWVENGNITHNFTNLEKIIRYWEEGKIIAIKGIGGYLLTCDATNEQAIRTLRQRKKRPAKPFALMYPNLEKIRKDVSVSKAESNELQTNEAPIVLLNLKNNPQTPLALKEINNGLGRIGIMLPYTPLYDLLLSKFGKPIIATSGNITGSTIIFEDETAMKELSNIADVIIMNNREIVIPQDDGVVQFTKKHQQKIVLRRSRGKAPIYINPQIDTGDKSILATGSMLKSVFAFTHRKNIYISQFLGNTETYEAQENYEKTFKHLKEILHTEFDKIVTDKHPDYFATRFGKKLATGKNIPHTNIQHHKSHFYSVLAENNLINENDKILGVIWDGTGLGEDENIWGGEFFSYENKKITRLHHIGDFDFILADKMVKEPRISLLAIAHKFKQYEDYFKSKFTPTEWQVYQKLLNKSSLKSTSMGRLFDAVASLLFGFDIHKYDAEASMKLEWEATKYLKKNPEISPYIKNQNPAHFVDFIMQQIFEDLENHTSPEEIAAKFHLSLPGYILNVAGKYNFKKLAFSGGVFQNALLVDLILDKMGKNFELYFQKELSPNDEGIALGQLLYGLL